MAPPNYKCNSAFHLPHLIREDSLPLQGQPSADLDSGSPGFFGAYGQHLPKAFLPAEGGGVGRRGDACGAILAPLLWVQEELFILRSQVGPTAGPFMHRLPEILNLENTSLHPP